MNNLFSQKEILAGINDDEVEALKEDVDYINSKINKYGEFKIVKLLSIINNKKGDESY